jgi:hypothetical protein
MGKELFATILFDANYIEPALLTSYLILRGQYRGISGLCLIYIDKQQPCDVEAKNIIHKYVEHFYRMFPLHAIKICNTLPDFNKYHFTNAILYKPLIPSLIGHSKYIINFDAGIIPGSHFDSFINQTINQCLINPNKWIISAFCDPVLNSLPVPIKISDESRLYPNGQVLLFNKENFDTFHFDQRYMVNYEKYQKSLVYAEQELMCITADTDELSELPLANERTLYGLDLKSMLDKNLILDHAKIDEHCIYSKVIGTLKPWKYWVLDANKKHWIEKIRLMEAEFPISHLPLIIANRHHINHTKYQQAFVEYHHNLL